MKNNTLILLLTLVLVFIACNGNAPKKPDNLLSKSKMMDVLYDLYLLNAANNSHKKILEKNKLIPETYLLEKYDMDSIQFAQSNNYYASFPEDYQEMLTQLEERFIKEKSVFDNIQKIEDSINKIKNDSLRTTRLNNSKLKDSLKPIKTKVGLNGDAKLEKFD